MGHVFYAMLSTENPWKSKVIISVKTRKSPRHMGEDLGGEQKTDSPFVM